MVVNTNRDTLNINKVVYEKEEMIFVEGDMIVPDAKPDILSAISTCGSICIYKKELKDEKIKIDGNINTYVMYIPDSTQDIVRGINVNLDFSKLLDASNCNENMILDVRMELEKIECNVINGRKISIKAGINVKYKIYSNESVEIINEILENDDIQTMKNNAKVNSLIGSGKTKAYTKDTITIDSADNLAEILKVNINMIDRDVKTSYNKVLAKTEAEIKIMYLTEDNRIVTCTNRIPIVGFIDIQDVSEDNICDINFEIKNMIIKPNSAEEHSIYIELEIEVSCMTYEEKEIELLQDLYSPIQEINCNNKEIKIISNKKNRKEKCNIRDTINIPELVEGELIDADCRPKITKVNKLNSRINCEGEVEICLLYLISDTDVKKTTVTVPFECTFNDIEDTKNTEVTLCTEVGSTDFIIKSGGDVVTDIDLLINANFNNNKKLNIIDNIEITDNIKGEDYSLIIYIVKKGDTLWNIAKKMKSTVDDIVKANGIENANVINIGDKLYIPKYNRLGANA